MNDNLAQAARCPECNAILGTMGVTTPPHLPGCEWYATYCRLMQNVAWADNSGHNASLHRRARLASLLMGATSSEDARD